MLWQLRHWRRNRCDSWCFIALNGNFKLTSLLTNQQLTTVQLKAPPTTYGILQSSHTQVDYHNLITSAIMQQSNVAMLEQRPSHFPPCPGPPPSRPLPPLPK
ncbi:hypothetical protein CMQ_4530 [Grosmannia clavigera kw1407]|uniref:Uncharacterized protein n=1 Tax=Grosmannia clavigera (strain kw1407 / UAMH 11150) TaxID=655863 RepID=F0XU38_GROCL|nr:uncharacterized protein CMQ_4530 [Grosmannia clavigera kw1407]EFW98678.1 hypothetical protein CMQ_4530 [Grosmannia clavigera kw1407]